MIEPRDAAKFRELWREHGNLGEEIIVSRFAAVNYTDNYPDAAGTIRREEYKILAEITPVPLREIQVSGGVLLAGDFKVYTRSALNGTGRTPTLKNEIIHDDPRADKIFWRNTWFRVIDRPLPYCINKVNTLWMVTIRTLSQ